jgi:endonuclease YncB( thermonuclease family)
MRQRDLLAWLAIAVATVVLALSWPASDGVFNGRASVIDGDTIHVGSHRVRLFGIDSPELAQMCGAVACGEKARVHLVGLIADRPVSCRKVDTDKFKRTVATCTPWRGQDLSEEMVRAGWAIELRYYSQGRYSAAEREARAAGAGVWSLKFQRPSEFRAEHKR